MTKDSSILWQLGCLRCPWSSPIALQPTQKTKKHFCSPLSVLYTSLVAPMTTFWTPNGGTMKLESHKQQMELEGLRVRLEAQKL